MQAKILLVEDDQIVAADIEESLHDFGYEVCESVPTGEDAVRAAREHCPDAVLMDIRLAGEMDGIDAAAEISTAQNIPVVYLTAHSDAATLERAKVTKPYGYVLKPFEDIELRVALEIAIYRSQEERQKTTEVGTSQFVQTNYGEGQDSSQVLALLKQLHPFSKVSDLPLSNFASKCRVRSYQSSEYISHEGEETDSAGFIVLSGRVAMLKTSASGRELIVELLPPGDCFALLEGMQSKTSPVSARAQLATEVLHVSRKTFLSLLTEVPELYREFMAEISYRLRASHSISRALAHDKVEVRIASALNKLLSDFTNSELNDDSSDRAKVIEITRQELADLTGTTVETAIRITKSFEKDGLLDLSRAGFIRVNDPKSLAALADI